MKKSKKITITIALCFIFAGVLICAGVFIASNFNFERFDSSVYITNDYKLNEKINNININCDTAGINILISEDNTCKITCYENEKLPHTVMLEDGTLTITKAQKHWYDYIKMFSFRSPKITLYLPDEMFDSLIVNTDTGYVNTESISATTMELKTSTGHINLQSTAYAEYIDVKASTGKVNISNTNCNKLKSETSTGDIALMNINAIEVEAKANTGDIRLQSTIAEGNISAKASTGDIIFEDSDGKNIFAKTSTGHITGTILTSKNFTANSSTGKVSVPNTQGTGIFEASASTGDIIISYSLTQ